MTFSRFLLVFLSLNLMACFGLRTDLKPDEKTKTDGFFNKPEIESSAISHGDEIKVFVYKEPDLSGSFKVPLSGKISLPLVGRIKVRGKTAENLEKEIRFRLAKDYLNDPKVIVIIQNSLSQQVFIMGAVKKPGAIQFKMNLTLMQALTLAGGLTLQADSNATVITRLNEQAKQKNNKRNIRVNDINQGRTKDVFLWPGDIIYIPESYF